MAAADELNEVLKLIADNDESLRGNEEQERLLNLQIASLNMDIARLRDARRGLRKRSQQLARDKESAERKIAIEKEAALVQADLEVRKQELEEVLKKAPWYNDAFDWQIDGALLLPERALLGDKRGLGKTLSSLIWRRAQGAKKTLICLRSQVADDFIKEIGFREPGLFVYNLIGKTSDQRKIAATLLNAQEEFVVVTNIESWRQNVESVTDDILRIDYDAVILDEAHHIKNAKTSTAQGFLRIADRVPKLLELTGTPIKNRPQEMFTLLHALYPDLFPTERKFLADFCWRVSQNKWAFTQEGVVALVKMISAFYVSRTPEDIGRKVPPPRQIEYKLDMNLHEKQRIAYQQMTERSLAILESGAVLPVVSQLAMMTRQAQMVSWPAGIVFKDPETGELVRFDVAQSAKMDWAEEILKELVEEGERVVLFSRFKPAIYELRRRLAEDMSVAVITGDEKGSMLSIFNDFDLKTAPTKPKYDVLLATYQTVGESANFNAARHAILFDRYWNPGNDEQAIGRIDRINSLDQATVHLPYVENTIDEYMIKLINDKRDMVTGFKDAASQQASLIAHLRKSL